MTLDAEGLRGSRISVGIMKFKKLYYLTVLILFFSVMANALATSAIWHAIEHYAFGLFSLLLSLRIVNESRESNIEKKACSGLITQMACIFPPDLESDTPYKRVEVVGYFFGIYGMVMIVTTLMKLFGW